MVRREGIVHRPAEISSYTTGFALPLPLYYSYPLVLFLDEKKNELKKRLLLDITRQHFAVLKPVLCISIFIVYVKI